jgi:hypothetical protein
MRAAAACKLFAAPLIAALAVLPAFAEDAAPMVPDDFLSLVEGKTVHYTKDGEHYGSERFYGKGRATWQFPGATCEDGTYWTVETEICFKYGTSSCWSVLEDEKERRAAVSRDGFSVIIARIDDRPLRCDGNPIS